MRLEVPRLLLCEEREVVPRLLLSCCVFVVVPLVREEVPREVLPVCEVDVVGLSLLRVEDVFLLLSDTLPLREEVLLLLPVSVLLRSEFVDGVETLRLLFVPREVLVPSLRDVALLLRLLLSSVRVVVPSREVLPSLLRFDTLLPRVLPSFTTPVRLGAVEVVPRPVVRSVTELPMILQPYLQVL